MGSYLNCVKPQRHEGGDKGEEGAGSGHKQLSCILVWILREHLGLAIRCDQFFSARNTEKYSATKWNGSTERFEKPVAIEAQRKDSAIMMLDLNFDL